MRRSGWIARFMAGRYGADQYSRFLSIAGCALLSVSLLTRNVGSGYVSSFFFALALTAVVWCYIRMLSRRFERRIEENVRYLRVQNAVTGYFRLWRDCFRQRKDYRFFRCPGCRAIARVPRGKGRIRITCRHCGYAFEKKT